MDRIGWTITFEDKSFCESDLTLLEAARALDVCGGSWSDLHPFHGPDQLVALLATFLASTGEDFAGALERVAQIRMVDALSMISLGEERPDVAG